MIDADIRQYLTEREIQDIQTNTSDWEIRSFYLGRAEREVKMPGHLEWMADNVKRFIASGDYTHWLEEGIVVIKSGFYLSPRKQKEHPDAFKVRIEEDIAEAGVIGCPWHHNEISETRAWLQLTPYTIYKMVKDVEHHVTEYMGENLLSMVRDDDHNSISDVAKRFWREMVLEKIADLRK